jgi:hypothetical protein
VFVKCGFLEVTLSVRGFDKLQNLRTVLHIAKTISEGLAMSQSNRKFPEEVEGIYIMGENSQEGEKLDLHTDEELDRRRNVSKKFRNVELDIRAIHLAASAYFKTFIELHDASNSRKKNGSLQEFPKNVRKARKEALKTLRDNSENFKQWVDPEWPELLKGFKSPKIPGIGRIKF